VITEQITPWKNFDVIYFFNGIPSFSEKAYVCNITEMPDQPTKKEANKNEMSLFIYESLSMPPVISIKPHIKASVLSVTPNNDKALFNDDETTEKKQINPHIVSIGMTEELTASGIADR